MPALVRVVDSNGTVEGTNIQFNSSYDALFGRREVDDSLSEDITFLAGENLDLELTTFIRNDLHPEGLECFTLQIQGTDALGHHDICHEDSAEATDYFCKHTICIEDDDGQFDDLRLSLCL